MSPTTRASPTPPAAPASPTLFTPSTAPNKDLKAPTSPPQATRDVKTTAKRRRLTCSRCQKEYTSDHKARHLRRCNKDSGRIENSANVSELLRRCGISPDDLGWDVGKLDALPNMRCTQQPAPLQHHTPWQYFTASDLGGLPTLESMLVKMSHSVRSGKLNDAAAQVWDGDSPVRFSPEEWANWPTQVLEGKTLSTRIFNVPAYKVIEKSETETYSSFASDVMARVYPPTDDRDITILPPDFLVTPRLTKSELHHDSFPAVNVARGFHSKPAAPLKLWLLWPSTELQHLASVYGKTEDALGRMDHGCFFVQMPGDVIAVPGNSPHAVLALQSCYVYGHVFLMTLRAYDPPALQVELRVTADLAELGALESYLRQLELGLDSPDFCDAHVDSFTKSWSAASPALKASNQARLLGRFVKIWSNHIRKNQSCPWCAVIGWEHDRHLDVDAEQHARAHLEGKVPRINHAIGADRDRPCRNMIQTERTSKRKRRGV